MKFKPFQPYTIDDDTHTSGYTIAFPVVSDTKEMRGGMTGMMVSYIGWEFYPAHPRGQAVNYKPFGHQFLEFEYREDISKTQWDINEMTYGDQKQEMIKEIFKFYGDKK